MGTKQSKQKKKMKAQINEDLLAKYGIEYIGLPPLLSEPLLHDNNNAHDQSKFTDRLLSERNLYGKILKHFHLTNYTNRFSDIPEDIDTMIHKYNHFMILLKNNTNNYKNKPLQLDLSIQFIWRVHLLHPIQYISDCVTYFGHIVCPSHTSISDPSSTMIHHIPKSEIHNTKQFTQMDLKASAKVQLRFLEQEWRLSSVVSYKRFLIASGYLSDKRISPTRIMDFIWHTHMTHFANYVMECKHFARSRVLGHDDIDMPNHPPRNSVTEMVMEWDSDEFDRINPHIPTDLKLQIKKMKLETFATQKERKAIKNVKWSFGLYQEAMKIEATIVVTGYLKGCNQLYGITMPMERFHVLLNYYFVTPEQERTTASSDACLIRPSNCSITLYFYRIEDD